MQHLLKQYQVDKKVWTEADFENMSWHDVHIHAISFGKDWELLFDIDYIFEWVQVNKILKFWISPCTLVFENVYDLVIEAADLNGSLVIDSIERIDPTKPKNAEHINRDTEYTWEIQLVRGFMSFKSVGFKQYVRTLPQFQISQELTRQQRGSVSFAKEGFPL